MLKATVARICKTASIAGHKTHHSVGHAMTNHLLDSKVSLHVIAQLNCNEHAVKSLPTESLK